MKRLQRLADIMLVALIATGILLNLFMFWYALTWMATKYIWLPIWQAL